MEPLAQLPELESPEFRRGFDYGRMCHDLDDHSRRLAALEQRSEMTKEVAEVAMDVAQDAAQAAETASEIIEEITEAAIEAVHDAAQEAEHVVEAVAETAEAVAEAVADHEPADETEVHHDDVTIVGDPEIQAPPMPPAEKPARSRRHGVYGRH